MLILGKNLVLSLAGVPVAAAKSGLLQLEQSMISICSPRSGGWKDYVSERKGWSASVDMLLTDGTQDLEQALVKGEKLQMTCVDADRNVHLYGDVLIEKLLVTGTVGNVGQCSVQLRGCGALRDYKSRIDLSGLDMAHADDRTIVINEQTGKWDYEQDQYGSEVVVINGLSRLIRVTATGEYPVLILSATNDASELAELVENCQLPEDCVRVVVYPGEDYILTLKDNYYRTMVVRGDAESFTDYVRVDAM